MRVEILTPDLIRLELPDGSELHVVRLDAIDGGSVFCFDKTARPVGRYVRLAIESALAEQS